MVRSGRFLDSIFTLMKNPNNSAKKIVENMGNIISTHDKGLSVAIKVKNKLEKPEVLEIAG